MWTVIVEVTLVGAQHRSAGLGGRDVGDVGEQRAGGSRRASGLVSAGAQGSAGTPRGECSRRPGRHWRPVPRRLRIEVDAAGCAGLPVERDRPGPAADRDGGGGPPVPEVDARMQGAVERLNSDAAITSIDRLMMPAVPRPTTTGSYCPS